MVRDLSMCSTGGGVGFEVSMVPHWRASKSARWAASLLRGEVKKASQVSKLCLTEQAVP
jgi:hypothetical protein